MEDDLPSGLARRHTAVIPPLRPAASTSPAVGSQRAARSVEASTAPPSPERIVRPPQHHPQPEQEVQDAPAAEVPVSPPATYDAADPDTYVINEQGDVVPLPARPLPRQGADQRTPAKRLADYARKQAFRREDEGTRINLVELAEHGADRRSMLSMQLSAVRELEDMHDIVKTLQADHLAAIAAANHTALHRIERTVHSSVDRQAADLAALERRLVNASTGPAGFHRRAIKHSRIQLSRDRHLAEALQLRTKDLCWPSAGSASASASLAEEVEAMTERRVRSMLRDRYEQGIAHRIASRAELHAIDAQDELYEGEDAGRDGPAAFDEAAARFEVERASAVQRDDLADLELLPDLPQAVTQAARQATESILDRLQSTAQRRQTDKGRRGKLDWLDVLAALERERIGSASEAQPISQALSRTRDRLERIYGEPAPTWVRKVPAKRKTHERASELQSLLAGGPRVGAGDIQLAHDPNSSPWAAFEKDMEAMKAERIKRRLRTEARLAAAAAAEAPPVTNSDDHDDSP